VKGAAKRTARGYKKKDRRRSTALDNLTRAGVAYIKLPNMPSNGEHIPIRRHSINQLETYDVAVDDLDRIEAECKNVGQDLQFASNSLSFGISFLIALIFTTIDSPKVFACFFAVMVLMFVLSVYFGIRYYRTKETVQSTIQRIKERQVGPVGEEGSELSPKVLANLPVGQAPAPPTDVVIVEHTEEALAAAHPAAKVSLSGEPK
jgi:ABC-type multidrug transport system fused ATPase/permease subunit